VVNVDVSPNTVNLFGPIDQISKIGSIGLDPPINLATLPGSEVLTRNVSTGFDQVKAEPSTAKVTVTVSQSSACAPQAPSPTPSPTR
jgi:YbbR domain-containing protein